MESSAKRRLALFGGGVLLAVSVATLVQIPLVAEGVVDAEPYAVAVGLGVSMPLLLAGAYPLTGENVDSLRGRTLLAIAESALGITAGVGAVALLVVVVGPNLFSVGGGAAATYLGAVVARALVLGRLATRDSAEESD